jgi:GMP synthase (glutamine-hydrolysing)
MRPRVRPTVLVLQHLSTDGPAYLATWLQRVGIDADVRNTGAGEPYPDDLTGYAGLAILGGEMSANDPLPSLRQAERLVLQAMDRGVPVIGHCLGGQLMARALRAQVVDSPAPEVGWQPIDIVAGPAAEAWFGPERRPVVFQWHYEAFELPPGAERLAGSAACPNQAFAIGPHLGMQFHIEVDAEKVGRWSQEQSARYRQASDGHAASVQDGDAIRRGVVRHLPAHHALADRVYRRWASALTL